MRKTKNHLCHQTQGKVEHNQQSGFTMIETTIAMVIVLIAALASASLFAYSIKNNSGANDRELAMAVAQEQLERLRSVAFTDSSLNATTGVTTTVTSANRQYTVRTAIVHSNVVNGNPTIKTITIRVTPLGVVMGSVNLQTARSTIVRGPY